MKAKMWGEFETFTKPATTTKPLKLSCRVAAAVETFSLTETQSHSHPAEDRGTPQDGASCSADEPDPTDSLNCLDSMIMVIAASGSPIKSQQLGEPDLTVGEKKEVLMEQYKTKPLVFLERYHAHLKPKHLEAFAHVNSDCRAQFYCTEVQKRASKSAQITRVRNHRYAALRALQKEGQYFSEEQMRFREPLLYEQYIGQYLTDEEILERSKDARMSGPITLSELLIHSYQEKELQNRIQEEQNKEDCEEEEEEEEDDEKDKWMQAGWEPTVEEKAMLREEFLSQMHQSFIDGKDKDFNYSAVDENPNYDNLDIVSRDAEERYFDEDDEEEDEEELCEDGEDKKSDKDDSMV